jgi:branched-chain amino acid transport system substrate-binding protein
MRLPARLLATAAAMVLSASFAQAQQAPIKIGAVLSATGGASFLGDPEKRTLELYVADINAKGGINGRKVEAVIYDDASNPNNARTFATRLIEQDKVDALLAGSTTASALAMIPLA